MQLQRVHQEGHVVARRRGRDAVERWATLALMLGLGACNEAPRAVAVALGGAHSCALDRDGQVWCWGRGQLEPTRVSGLPKVVSIAAGADHSCAVGSDGRVWCWGAGERGQLGDGMMRSSSTPVAVVNLTDAVAMAAGDLHSCARSVDGQVSCWGDNSTAQIVYPATTEPQATPLVAFDGTATGVSAGGLDGVSRTCVVADGEVVCWGRLEPAAALAQLAGSAVVAVGADHVCGVGDKGRLRCDGTVPTQALDELASLDFTAVSAGALHTCAARADGSAWCFGDNLNGQLGAGERDAHEDAVLVLTGSVTAMGVGALHSCAVLDDGSVRCWGENNNGRLGTGSLGGVETSPQRVALFGE